MNWYKITRIESIFNCRVQNRIYKFMRWLHVEDIDQGLHVITQSPHHEKCHALTLSWSLHDLMKLNLWKQKNVKKYQIYDLIPIFVQCSTFLRSFPLRSFLVCPTFSRCSFVSEVFCFSLYQCIKLSICYSCSPTKRNSLQPLCNKDFLLVNNNLNRSFFFCYFFISLFHSQLFFYRSEVLIKIDFCHYASSHWTCTHLTLDERLRCENKVS